MPFINDNSSLPLAGDFSTSNLGSSTQHVVLDDAYVATSFPNYNERPLSEQLEPIAVIGMGCRLPGDIKSPSDFWSLMIDKRTGQTPKVPASRFNIDAHLHPDNDRPGSFSVPGGYFLNETVQEFDPSFFGITPIEAMWMDPQQRKLLEVAYESFESAGVTLQDISGSQTAVFIASFTSDYQQMAFKEPSHRHSFAATGVDTGILSNRISHVFNLKGPSMYVNTACSSSVYALHNACNALRSQECEAAVVGGVNLIITVDQHMNTAKLGVLSPTSICHTFDASADGYGRAEGVGAVYLKRLSDAVREGDPIRAVIRSSATNNNGKVPGVGITHPNCDGQVEVITQAYRRGGNLDPRLTGYFECHGTGTPVGDPLEVHAVSLAMNRQRGSDEEPLMIGAVKTSIGHSEAASGLSALIKAVLTVERGVIPATRGIVTLNPAVEWKNWQVSPVMETSLFPVHLPVRRVSVNSFGYGGTNAHVIVEGADSLLARKQTHKFHDPHFVTERNEPPRSALERKRPFLLTFSAHEKSALKRNMIAHGAVAANYDLADLAYTLGNRRSAFAARSYVIASHDKGLDNLSIGQIDTVSIAENKRAGGLCFVFTGQGAQWARMGADLMDYYPSFRNTIRTLDIVLKGLGDDEAPNWAVEDVLLEPKDTSRIISAEFAQPLTTAVQVALVNLLRSWGVIPSVVVGHSSGEIAAAYAAGYISASDAIILAYFRGKVVRDIKAGGKMLAVGLGADSVQPYLNQLEGKVVIACHNSPSGVTLSGDATAIDVLQAKLSSASIFARAVKTDGKAYHSPHMAAAASRYETLVRRAKETAITTDRPLSTMATMVSSVTSTSVARDTVLDASYFSTNLAQPVLFNQALQHVFNTPSFSHVDTLVEVGPHSALAGPIRQVKSALSLSHLTYLPTLIRNENSATNLLSLAGELFIRQYSQLDMEKVTSVEASRELRLGKDVEHKRGNLIVDLPPYQWGTKCYWAESRQSYVHRFARHARHDLLGSMMPGCSMMEPTWRNILRVRDVPWLRDHCLGGEAVFPAAGYFSMAMEAITQVLELDSAETGMDSIERFVLRDVEIHQALVTPDDDIGVEVLTNLRPVTYYDGRDLATGGIADRWFQFSVSSVSVTESPSLSSLNSPRASKYTSKTHMSGRIKVTAGKGRHPMRFASATPPIPLSKPLTQRASAVEWYSALQRVGFHYGPTFNDMSDIRFNGKDYICEAKTTIKNTATVAGTSEMVSESRYFLHPACVDTGLQLMIAAIYAGKSKAMKAAAVPVHVEEVIIWNRHCAGNSSGCSGGTITSWASERASRSFITGTEMADVEGRVLMRIEGMKCVFYEAAVPQRAQGEPDGRSGQRSMEYGKMVWELDVDELLERPGVFESDEDGEVVVRFNGGVKLFVELTAFKRPGVRVLDIGGCFEGSLSHLDGVAYTLVKSDSGDVAGELSGFEAGATDLLIVDTEVFNKLGADIVLERLTETGRLIILDTLETPFQGVLASPTVALRVKAVLGAKGHDIGRVCCFGGTKRANGVRQALNGGLEVNKKTDIRLVYRRQAEQVLVAGIISAFSEFSDRCSLIPTIISDVHIIPPPSLAHVILLDTSEHPMLANLTESEFLAVQKLTTDAATLAWVTSGGLIDGKIPAASLSSGLLRSLRSEQASLKAVALDFEPLCYSSQHNGTASIGGFGLEQMAKIILTRAVQQIEDPSSLEEEYVYDGYGNCYISRLMPFESVNERYASRDKTELNEDTKTVPQIWDLALSEKMITARGVSGGTAIFEQSSTPGNGPGNEQVEVKVLQASLNRGTVDTLTSGDTPNAKKSCHEIGGVVTSVGGEVAGLAVGDTVVGLSFGKLGTYQTVSADLVRKVDPAFGTEIAESRLAALVSLPLAYAAAMYGLKRLADVQRDENVLVLPGTGPAGLAAIDVANLLGAVPYVLVSAPEEIAVVSGRYRLPAAQIIQAQDRPLSVLRNKVQLDVVFSAASSPEELSREVWRIIAPHGRLISLGGRRVSPQSPIDPIPFQRGASYHAFDITELSRSRPGLLQGLLVETFDCYNTGKLTGFRSNLEVRSIAELGDAVTTFSDDWNSPRTIISYASESSSSLTGTVSRTLDLVASTTTSPVAKLKAKATYLLVGCLGGLGRSLTSWMVEKGARNFCFLSRSGADAPEAGQLVQDLIASGANVEIVRGDVGKLEDVERAVRGIQAEAPLVGVVQAAMVLKDGLFHSSTYDDWTTSIGPKVHGTANLQTVLSALSHPLDFFLLTSSVSGILGTPGQANYAAGNAYLDAVARHRRANGQNACAAIVPMVLGVGVVAENDGLEEKLKSKGMYGIDEDELLGALEVAIVEQQRGPMEQQESDKPDHLVIGLDPTLLVAAAQDSSEPNEAFWMRDKRFSMLVHHMKMFTSISDKKGASSANIVSKITGAPTPQQAVDMARESIKGKLSRMLLLDADIFAEGEGRSVASFGIDSMIGAELRNWLFREFGLDIPFQQLLSPTLSVWKLAERVCETCGIVVAEGS